jgi:aspartate/methionine/tyrosine aminotransferase
VALTVLALCRPGDQVLIPAPYWVSYPEMVRLAGAEPIGLSTTAEDEYRLNPESLEEAINENTRMIILCSPSNPTGSVYPPAELEALAEVLRRHEQVFVISDEIYEKVIYDAEHVSMAALPGMAERTITVNGFSKAYAMTGWRLGYSYTEPELASELAAIQSQITSNASSPAQYAALAAYQDDARAKDAVRAMVRVFQQRRDKVLAQIEAELPAALTATPDGAFFLFLKVDVFYSDTIKTSSAFCSWLLEATGVALVPGSAFGDDRFVRLSLAAPNAALAEAIHRMGVQLSKAQLAYH